MGRLVNRLIVLVLVLTALLPTLVFFNSGSKQNVFGMEQFLDEMKAKGYQVEVQDVSRDFLPTERKRMIVDNEAIDIYLYQSSIAMEKDARRIDPGGWSYEGLGRAVFVSWVSEPHFY